MESDLKAAIDSISSCISVLLGDLQQPGTPAIVLKLAASWEKLKPCLVPQGDASLQLSTELEQEQADSSAGGKLLQVEDSTPEDSVQAPNAHDVATRDGDTDAIPMATQLNSEQGLASESNDTESSGLLPD